MGLEEPDWEEIEKVRKYAMDTGRWLEVMGCDDEAIPMQERIASASDEFDLEDVFQTECHLLYVDCTRARDSLLVTGVDLASKFLDDLTFFNKNEIAMGQLRDDHMPRAIALVSSLGALKWHHRKS